MKDSFKPSTPYIPLNTYPPPCPKASNIHTYRHGFMCTPLHRLVWACVFSLGPGLQRWMVVCSCQGLFMIHFRGCWHALNCMLDYLFLPFLDFKFENGGADGGGRAIIKSWWLWWWPHTVFSVTRSGSVNHSSIIILYWARDKNFIRWERIWYDMDPRKE